ncbi:MAG: Jag N-terminal domain-containing protein [Candidatus Coatesbacteria bacterium]|nr:MAG: Jag N-terminal domain-containing protein [Candidatus Coatesbacteria bacterium]
MRSVEVTGSSRVDATKKGLKLLGAEIDEVKVEVVKEERRGVFGWLGFKQVTVRVTIVEENVLEMAADVVKFILSYIPVPVESQLDVKKNVVTIKLEGGEIRKFQKKEDFAGALEYVVELLLNRRSRKAVRVKASFAEAEATGREKKLAETARRAADKAVGSGKPVELQPMTSWERRIVHLTLEPDGRVYTESRGKGNKRRVVVYPKGYEKEKTEPKPEKKKPRRRRRPRKTPQEKAKRPETKQEKPPEGRKRKRKRKPKGKPARKPGGGEPKGNA